MRKRICQFINSRHLLRTQLCLMMLASLGIITTTHANAVYDDYPVKEVKTVNWTKGTLVDGVEVIELDWSILEQPVDPMEGDSICFEFTATNLCAEDTLQNVMILKEAVKIASAMTLLPNGVMAGSMINPFTGSGTFTLTGSGCKILTAQDIQNGFVVCPATAMGFKNGEPAADCVDAMACFDITLACTDYNISLDAECETLLTPGLLSITTPVPDSLLRIRIQEPNGDFRDEPMVDAEDVGSKVKVVVDIPGCPNVAPCWSYAFIEYKLGPALICNVDTVSCAMQVGMNDPVITVACGTTRLIRGETIRENLCQVDTLFLAKETTSFAVVDQFGNVSDTCIQVRYILKPNLKYSDIVWPAADTVLNCGSDIFDEDGDVLPRFGGVPTWDGVDLTDRDFPASCNVLTEYEDLIELDQACERIIVRKWMVNEWLCRGGVTRLVHFQRIRLVDTTPPEIQVQSDVINLTVNKEDCTALFDVPAPTVTDVCQPDSTIEVEIRYPGGSSLTGDGKDICIPFGDGNIVEYIARDRCGNESRDTTIVNVVDLTTPVAICLRELVISITDTAVTMPVEKFDESSYDACGIDRITVRKMFEACDTLDTVEGPSVTFCCSEAGRDIPVILRVYDMSGNFNECMVMVMVQDKSDAIVTCPPDTITISCDFDFNPNGELDDLFGTVREGGELIPLTIPREFVRDSSGRLVNGTYEDNCGIGTIEEVQRIVDIDSICRTGTICRTIQVTDVSGNITTCKQVIRIVGDQQNNPLEWAYFPPDVKLEAMDPDDVRRLAIDNPPRVENTGCSLIGIGFTDQAFHLDTGMYCTKIVRTWQVIDWCRNPTGLVELDSIQYIFVIDNEAPEITLNSPITVPAPLSGDAIELVATATDNVISNPKLLDWSYEVFGRDDINPVRSGEIAYEEFKGSSAVIRLVNLPLGDYRVFWYAMDKCMNTDTAMQDLTIVERSREGEVNVVGQVLFSQGGMMDEVDVFLTEQETVYENALSAITDVEGAYSFANMPMGGSYYIDPKKNIDPLNGVSTLDLILIQRHILGLNELASPALKIAADVNNDKLISALDLVELRRLLLGYNEEFTNKDSWVFAYEAQDLEEVASYGVPLQERYYIDELVTDMDISFIGIKTGDVSGDAIGNSTGISDIRSRTEVLWRYDLYQTEEHLIVQIKTEQAARISGFQTELSWPGGMELITVEPGKLPITMEHYNSSGAGQGRLPISFNEEAAIEVGGDEILFSLVFGLTTNTPEIELDEEGLSSEVYVDGAVSELILSPDRYEQEGILQLSQNTPNPWSETTVIEADIPLSGQAHFRIYDLHNRLIHEEVREVERGTHRFMIGREEISQSGVYFYEVGIEGMNARQKMIRVN